MWTHWSPTTFGADMATAARMGAGTVRLIVFPDVFGYPTPRPGMADRLESAVSLAHQHGLTVQLTLFDSWDDYGDLDGSRTWTTALLSRYRKDSRVSSVEVRNETDPSDDEAMTWARSQIRLLHSLLPSTPVTISTDSGSGADGLVALRQALGGDPPDFYSLHYYGQARLAYDSFRRAAAAVAPAPLVIGEAGYSTDQDGSASTGRDGEEDDQASWYRVVQSAARDAGLAPAAPWTLYDFTRAGTPDTLAKVEYGFGLLRTDGHPKPAAVVVAAAFAGRLSTQPYNGDFADLVDGGARAAGWTAWMPTGSARVEPGQGVGGANALVFSGTRRQEHGLTSWRTVPTQAVRPGDTWTVTVHARARDASGLNDVALAWFDARGHWLGNTSSNQLGTGQQGWQVLVATGAVPAAARAVEIHLRSAGNSGEVDYSQVNWTVNGK